MFENDWDRNHVKEIEIPTLGRQNSPQQTKHTHKILWPTVGSEDDNKKNLFIKHLSRHKQP